MSDENDIIEIDHTDPTLPDNYLQLKAALERDCEKWEAIAETKTANSRKRNGYLFRV